MQRNLEIQLITITLLAFFLMVLGFSAVSNGITRITSEDYPPPIGIKWDEGNLNFNWFAYEKRVNLQESNQNIRLSIKDFSREIEVISKDFKVIINTITLSLLELGYDTKNFFEIWSEKLYNYYVDRTNEFELELIRI